MRYEATFRRSSKRGDATGKARRKNSKPSTRTGGGYEASTARAYCGELAERSFAHCYETGGLRRYHLRGRDNILKRQLVHVGAFNLGLILRHLLGAGTPRELSNRSGQLVLGLFLLLSYGNGQQRCRSSRISPSATKYVAKSRTRLRRPLCRKSTPSTTAC